MVRARPRGSTGERVAALVTPQVLAVAAMSVLFGVAVAVAIVPHTWAVDASRNLAAAEALLDGQFGSDRGYLYSPLAAALTVPATWLPAGLAVVVWFLLRLGVLVGGAVAQARGLATGDRMLAVLGAVFFIPCVLDLSLGNVSILLAAAVALVAWRRDAWWTGILVGLALATVPKPQLLPVLVWMVLFRPRAAAGALVTAGVATGLGVLVLGLDPYVAWFDVLRAPEYVASGSTQGNLALAAWLDDRLPELAVLALPLSVLAVTGAIAGLLRGPWPGFIACICLGLLVAPYTMAYGAVLLLLSVRPLTLVSPRWVLLLGLLAPLGIILAMPIWVAAVMAVAISVPRGAWGAVPFELPRWPWRAAPDLRAHPA